MSQKPSKKRNRAGTSHREQYMSDSDAWIENDGVYGACLGQLQQAGLLSALITDQNALARVPSEDRPRLVELSRQVAKDTKESRASLDKIHDAHVAERDAYHKANPVRRHLGMRQDDLMPALAVGEAYAQWHQEHSSVVLPNLLEAIGLFDPADRPDLPAEPTPPAPSAA